MKTLKDALMELRRLVVFEALWGDEKWRSAAQDVLAALDPDALVPGSAETQAKPVDVTSPETLKEKVPDVQLFGAPNDWKVLGKASSASQGWMHSTKALEVPGGVLVQTLTRVGAALSQALVFVPAVDLLQVKGNHYELRTRNPFAGMADAQIEAAQAFRDETHEDTQAEIDAELLAETREMIWPGGNYDDAEEPGLLEKLKHLLDPRPR